MAHLRAPCTRAEGCRQVETEEHRGYHKAPRLKWERRKRRAREIPSPPESRRPRRFVSPKAVRLKLQCSYARKGVTGAPGVSLFIVTFLISHHILSICHNTG